MVKELLLGETSKLMEKKISKQNLQISRVGILFLVEFATIHWQFVIQTHESEKKVGK